LIILILVDATNGIRIDTTGTSQFFASDNNRLANFSGIIDVEDASTMLANGDLIV